MDLYDEVMILLCVLVLPTCFILISPTRLSPSMPESESDLTEYPRSLIRPRVDDDVLLMSLPALLSQNRIL